MFTHTKKGDHKIEECVKVNLSTVCQIVKIAKNNNRYLSSDLYNITTIAATKTTQKIPTKEGFKSDYKNNLHENGFY